MNLFRGATWSSRLASRLLLALGLALTAPAMAGDIAAKGKNAPTVRELSAAWWQWALSIPLEANPLADDDGTLCGVGQHGNVWFLGGAVNISGEVTRSCKIPAGTRILLAVINGECSVVEDPSLGSRRALRACAKGQMDFVTEATATLDGRNARVIRTQSPLFSFTLPPGNVLGITSPAPNPSPAVADGFWVLIEQLAPGHHDITAHGTLVVPGPGGFTFVQDVTYAIKVVPPQFGTSAAIPQALVPSGAIVPAVVPSPVN
jgi:hypothetical protein